MEVDADGRPAASISTLPPEIILQIFRFLSVQDCERLRLTHRRWNTLIITNRRRLPIRRYKRVELLFRKGYKILIRRLEEMGTIEMCKTYADPTHFKREMCDLLRWAWVDVLCVRNFFDETHDVEGSHLEASDVELMTTIVRESKADIDQVAFCNVDFKAPSELLNNFLHNIRGMTSILIKNCWFESGHLEIWLKMMKSQRIDMEINTYERGTEFGACLRVDKPCTKVEILRSLKSKEEQNEIKYFWSDFWLPSFCMVIAWKKNCVNG